MSHRYQAGAQRALWALNARAVLEAIDHEGPLGRPELVRATGLSKTTVTQTLRSLVAQGVVAEAGLDATRRGPAAALFAIRPGCALALGVDVGPHRVTAALTDVRGTELARASAPIDGPTIGAVVGPVVGAVARAAAECAGLAGVPLEAAGQAVVGVRAIVARGHRTVRTPAPALPGDGRGLIEALEAVLPMPVQLENDVNLAAVAELHEGAGRGVSDFVLLGLGDGLGAGVVLDGRLHRGYAGGAGEVGFLPGPHTVPGAPVMTGRDLLSLAAAGLPASAAGVSELARAGDVRALRVLERVAGRLAVVIASITLVIEPELVVIGGPFGDPALLEPLRSVLRRDAGPLVISLAASAVPDDPVLRGALWQARLLAREAAFTTAVATAP